jgi:hypothetical protein
MPRKPIELSPAVAPFFVDDMRAFFVEKNAIKRDKIASRLLLAATFAGTGGEAVYICPSNKVLHPNRKTRLFRQHRATAD